MKKGKKIGLFVLAIILVTSCALTKSTDTSNFIITKSCQLKEHLNDTIVVKGIYSTCMEYSSFQTIKKDECSANFKMHINLSEKNISKDLIKEIYAMYACNAIRQMTVKGIIQKDQKSYGHLGTNNAEIKIIDIIDLGKIKYEEIKN